MKKFTNTIIAGAAAVCGFIFLALATLITEISYQGVSNNSSVTGYKLFDGAFEDAGNIFGNISAISQILLLVVAIVLVILAVLSLLNALNVIKGEKFGKIIDKIIFITLIVFASVALVSLISLFIYGGWLKDELLGGAPMPNGAHLFIGPGIGAWLMLVFSIIPLTANILCAKLLNKKAA